VALIERAKALVERQPRGAEPDVNAARLVWKQRFQPRASTGNGEEYKITHGWLMLPVGGGKTKRQFSVYHGRAEAQLADSPPHWRRTDIGGGESHRRSR
jgi:hypothetical protein